MRNLHIIYSKYIILLAAAAVFITGMTFHSPAAAFAEPPAAVSRQSSEVALYFKSAAAIYDGFVNSAFMEEFANTRLGARYEETIAAGKIAQLKRAINNSFSAAFSYEKALAFFDCPAALYVIDSDFDSLLLLFAVERDISKFEYFAKFKKGVKTEKYEKFHIYSLASEEGVDSLFFASFGSRTIFANDAGLIRSILSAKTSLEDATKTAAAPVTVFVNLKTLNAKVSGVYKNTGGQTIYIYPPSKDKEIKIAAFNGEEEPDPKLIEKAAAAADKIDVPADLSFAASVVRIPAAEFFAASLKYAEKFEMPAELKDALKSLSSSGGTGISLVISGGGSSKSDASSGLLGGLSARLAFGVDNCGEAALKALGKYLSAMTVEYKSPVLLLTNSPGSGAGETQWARNFNSINRVDASYFYYLKYDDGMAKMIENIIAASLAINSWQGSNAYELMSDLRDSAGVLKSLDRLWGVRLNGIEGLNSVIRIKLR
ncbi:MAG: hypothetical protein A2008_13575 [Candidatus Wallbacteria bacterium GWC2_49_35]|uniref:Uncharacterized protein n=1 Tax=Candidatus Wallbacteria bacterium GWC2_49_35 TaxID=1817813 RepID=A0A1F7WSG1_9BACT|nr:MAG: hypothetical protein A2008_13575 [Candidatus Wallbacteria bacterium GWC2_49_35]HBC74159.1 hypothetical protein [Candidatus Wallbacteria bacterium]